MLRQIAVHEIRWRRIVAQHGADYHRGTAGDRHQKAFLLAGENRFQPRIVPAVARLRRGVAMKNDIGKILAAEQCGAFGKIRPHILLQRGNPHARPMPARGAGRRGQCHGLFHRPGLRQGIRFDLHGTHLVDEPVNIRSDHAALRILEQSHGRVQPVVGGTTLRRVLQCHALPVLGHAGDIPCQSQHELRFLRRQGPHSLRHAVDQAEHPLERLKMRAAPYDAADHPQHVGAWSRLLVQGEHGVLRQHTERRRPLFACAVGHIGNLNRRIGTIAPLGLLQSLPFTHNARKFAAVNRAPCGFVGELVCNRMPVGIVGHPFEPRQRFQ